MLHCLGLISFPCPCLSLWTNHSFRAGADYIAWFVRKTMWLEFQLGECWTGYGKWPQIYTAYRSKECLSCDYLPMHYTFLFIYLLIYGLFDDAVSDTDHKSRLLRCYSVIKQEDLKKKIFWLNWKSYSATCVKRLRKAKKDLNQYWQYSLKDSSPFPGIKDENEISWGRILGCK